MNKRLKGVIASVVAMSMLVAPAMITKNVKAVTTQQIVNLAQGKTVVSSSIENASYEAKYAVDGNEATRWSSAWKDGEWIMVDLGKEYKIGTIQILWEAAYAANYTISWSNDNVTWNEAVDKDVNKYMATTSDMFYNRPARYIKLTINKRGTEYGASLFELKVFGYSDVEETTTVKETEKQPEQETTVEDITKATEETVKPNSNLAIGKKVIVSSEENSSYAAANAVDGDLNTRWSSAWRDGEWIMIDLGKIYSVGSVKIYWEAAYASQYTISWSQDNVNWIDACTMKVSHYMQDTCDMFYNKPVRYIKIKADKRATVYGASIYDIEIIGSEYNGNFVYRK